MKPTIILWLLCLTLVPLAETVVPIISGPPTLESANTALRELMTATYKRDGAAIYDWLPRQSRDAIEVRFAELAKLQVWKDDPNSKDVHNARDLFAMAGKSGDSDSVAPKFNQADVDKKLAEVLPTCVMEGDKAVYTVTGGNKLTIIWEGDRWSMAPEFAEPLVKPFLETMDIMLELYGKSVPK